MLLDKVIEEMRNIFREVPYGIDHTLKVLENAKNIMCGENLAIDEEELISIVAILHDIGIIEAQRKYGCIDEVYQEKEGPVVARKILENLGYASDKIERVCYIVGNHHTPTQIDGLDFQIQWEADLLENLPFMEVYKDKKELKQYIKDNFKTYEGAKIALMRFDE